MGVLRKLSALLFVLIILVCSAAPAFANNTDNANIKSVLSFSSTYSLSDGFGAGRYSFPSIDRYLITLSTTYTGQEITDIVFRDVDESIDASVSLLGASKNSFSAFREYDDDCPIRQPNPANYAGYKISLADADSLTFNFDSFVVPFDPEVMNSLFFVEASRWDSRITGKGYYVKDGLIEPFTVRVESIYGDTVTGLWADTYSALPTALYDHLVYRYGIDCKYIYFESLSMTLDRVDETSLCDFAVASRAYNSLSAQHPYPMSFFLHQNDVKYGVVIAQVGEVDFVEWAVTAVGSFFSLQIGPFTLGGIVSTFIGIALFLAFLMYFKG